MLLKCEKRAQETWGVFQGEKYKIATTEKKKKNRYKWIN
jgi:hypothetical protein